MTREAVAGKVWLWKQQGICVGMASGAFDMLHAGHLDFLTKLKEHCGKLVVAITSDAICREKGAGRPVIPAEQRLAMVEALKVVDAAFPFTEYGDDLNLEIVRPDIFGRGDGHTEDMYERKTLDRFGIKIVLIHTPRITSTTEIINRIRQ